MLSAGPIFHNSMQLLTAIADFVVFFCFTGYTALVGPVALVDAECEV